MKALFEVKEIVNDWAPPFQKKVTLNEFVVNEAEGFSQFDGTHDSVFRLITVKNGSALVEYSNAFTLKGHEHPQNHQVWLSRNQPVSFTFLWGEKGVTKTLVLKDVVVGGQAPAEQPQPSAESAAGNN